MSRIVLMLVIKDSNVASNTKTRLFQFDEF